MFQLNAARCVSARFCMLAVAAIALAGAPGQAAAQAWIGQIVGEMAAQQAAAQREAACRAGTPAAAKDITKINAKMTQLMADYFALTSASDARALKRVFAMRTEDVRWKDAAGETPVATLGARLDGETPTLTLVSSIVGGDAMSARGVWSSSSDGLIYAVDFLSEPGTGWRIWHMSILPAADAPEAPPAYCHFDPEQAF